MTGSSLLIDTNIAIDYFKGSSYIISIIQQQEVVYLPAIVLGELYVGAYRSNDELAKMSEIKELLTNCTLLNIAHPVIEKYALIKTLLLNKGKPIPENDIWIAATALQYNLPLFTADKHFKEVDGLQLFNPLSAI